MDMLPPTACDLLCYGALARLWNRAFKMDGCLSQESWCIQNGRVLASGELVVLINTPDGPTSITVPPGVYGGMRLRLDIRPPPSTGGIEMRSNDVGLHP